MKLSVALCIYNGHKYLAEQLHSIIYQSVKVDEIVVCDDLSTDGSADIIRSFQDQYPGLISYSLNSENMGAIRNFEQAIARCTGEIIFLSDQDDIWKPGKVEKILGRFHSDHRALLVFSNGDLVDDEGRCLNGSLWEEWHFDTECRRQWKNNHKAFLQLFANNNKVTGATTAFRSSLKVAALPITVPEEYWHDTWLALHAAARGGLRYIEESLIWYRIHREQQVGVTCGESFGNAMKQYTISQEEFEQIIRAKYPHHFADRWSILKIPIRRLRNYFLR